MLQGLKILPTNSKINFIGFRLITYIISGILAFGSLGLFFIKGVNYGIDFKGGTMIEVRTPAPANLAEMRSNLTALNLGAISLQEFGSSQDILIRFEQQKGDEKDQLSAIEKVKESLGADMEYRRIETVGPAVGAELVENSIYAVLWALVAMLIYIWLRFEWQFGVCAILSLAHDALSILGLYSLFGLEFNLTAIVAILITIGYSINDTVVIYDRVRENLRKFKKMALEDVLNLSINETLSRTILTSSSTLLALFALYFWGGEVISTYSLPILFGVAVGTYSSIFLAAPLLKSFNFKVRKDDDKKVEFQNDQKN
ncbi:MAG: protein translocase subunit SecF [Alphaproteobacteria bacterium]|nr:protein translocase subunit SecF [Alphaproteobacteria bacterium]